MATSRKRIRYCFDAHFNSHEEKESFLQKIKSVRQRMTPSSSPLLDNYSLFSSLLDKEETAPTHHSADAPPRCVMQNSGKYFVSY